MIPEGEKVSEPFSASTKIAGQFKGLCQGMEQLDMLKEFLSALTSVYTNRTDFNISTAF